MSQLTKLAHLDNRLLTQRLGVLSISSFHFQNDSKGAGGACKLGVEIKNQEARARIEQVSPVDNIFIFTEDIYLPLFWQPD